MTHNDDLAARLAALEGENVRLKRAVEELSVLNELATAIGGSRDSSQIMRRLVSRSLQTVHAEQGLVTLVSESVDDPTQTFVRSVSSSSDHDAITADASIVGWMHLHKQPLIVNDPSSDRRFSGSPWDERVRSVLAVPLLVQGRLTGVLTLYNKKSDGGFGEDDKRLMSILAAQSAQVLENARLHEDELELQRLQGELNLAREIQIRLLPDAPPAVPGYEFAGSSIPAQSVGGDFYDVVETVSGRVVFWVGDVSGKGLPASLTMANAQAALRSHATSNRKVADCVYETNQLLCRYTPRSTFVTLAMFALDLASSSLVFVNAGHVKPVILRAGGATEVLEHSNLVMGFQSSTEYTPSSCTLDSGDVLVLVSDGLSEAMNTRRVQFGDEAVYAVTAQARGGSAGDTLESLLKAVEKHATGAGQHDDITALVIRKL